MSTTIPMAIARLAIEIMLIVHPMTHMKMNARIRANGIVSAMISAIQSETKGAVVAMETAVDEVAKGSDKAVLETAALAVPNVQRALDGASPRKIIVVPDRLVNIVA